MSAVLDILGAVLLVAGLVFVLVAAVGFVRLPDVFSRLHVTGILDTLGAPLMLLGIAVWSLPTLVAAKLGLGLIFLFMTSPLIGHLLSRSALESMRRERDRTVPKGKSTLPTGKSTVPTATTADPEDVTS